MSVPTTYILDTNVLLSDPKSIFHFEEHEVIIPVQCLEELDRFKRERLSARGSAARTVSRYLDALRKRGSLLTGVPLHGGGTLRVDFGEGVSLGKADDEAVRLARRVQDERGRDHVVLVSRDTNMRIKADVYGVAAEDYRHDAAPTTYDEEGYRGYSTLETSQSNLDSLYRDNWTETSASLHPHEFVVLKEEFGGQQSALTRHHDGKLTLVQKTNPWGLSPRSANQSFALDALMNPDIPLVTLAGRAGTGKTLLALAAGLHQTCDTEVYRRTLVARPLISMGKEVGYLPGDLDEKLRPWMQPIFDNLEVLVGSEDERRLSYILERGHLKVEALSFIRGRSIPQQFLIVDEAQNLTPHEAKTILTRAGEGTKIVFTGDPDQIDHPYVDSKSNGLTYVIEAFRGSPLAAHMILERGERSPLAEEAATLL